MKVFVRYEDTEYTYEVELRRILQLLDLDVTEAQIEATAKQAVVES